MIAFYAQIKWVHVAAVICSISLFALRGALVQSGRGHWARGAPLRYLSYTIDTTLLFGDAFHITEIHHHALFRLSFGADDVAR